MEKNILLFLLVSSLVILVMKFLNLVLLTAIKDQASDIHFEPFEVDFKIRYRIDGELLDAAPRLRVVSNMAVGFNNIDVEACTSNGVLLTNTPDGVRRPVACSYMALILALSHDIS